MTFYDRVLTWVSVEEAKESGELLFVVPAPTEVYLLFFMPDGYVFTTEIREFRETLEALAGLRQNQKDVVTISTVMNLLSRTLAPN